jgi:hypothetical protein
MKFFPTIDDVIDHALAFSRVMVAHAGFEAEVRNLQSTIVGDETFGEQPCNQWPADKRPARMANLIKERLGEIEEIHPIKALLARAIKPTRARNLLAHGTWWCFDPETSTITVRHGTVRPGEPVHVEVDGRWNQESRRDLPRSRSRTVQPTARSRAELVRG